MNTLNTDFDFLNPLFGEETSTTESPEYPDAYLEYYEATKDVDNSHMHWDSNTPKTLEELIVAMVNNQPDSQVKIGLKDYLFLLHRGLKPTKALFRLGVEQQLAGILGSLKLATTAEEIQAVYDNPSILSCMTKRFNSIGQFYSNLGVQVLYSDRYRILLDLNRNWKSVRGYGVLFEKIDPLLTKVLHTYILEINIEVRRSSARIHMYWDETSCFSFDNSIVNGIKSTEIPYLDSIELNYGIDTDIDKLQEDVLKANSAVIGTNMETFLDIFDIASSELVWAEYDTLYADYTLIQQVKDLGEFRGYSNHHRSLPIYEYDATYYIFDGYNIIMREIKYTIDMLVTSKNPDGTVNIDMQEDFPF